MTVSATAQVYGPTQGTLVEVGDAQLDTHLDGPPDGEVMLLVSGLSRQRIEWPVALVRALHGAGMRTLTVDNRDVGRSTRFPDGSGDQPPYRIADFASDHLGILDHYGLERVHVLGTSMGGMIAQQLAITAPERLVSLTSVMSTTGDPRVGSATDEAVSVLTAPVPTEREAYVEQAVRSAVIIGSPGHVDEEAARRRIEAAYDRAFFPRGVLHQLQAIMGSGDRTEALAEVEVPTLVLHGSADPLIDVSGGEATAAAIGGARLHVVDGMGHDLPLAFLPEVVGAVVGHVRDAAPRD